MQEFPLTVDHPVQTETTLRSMGHTFHIQHITVPAPDPPKTLVKHSEEDLYNILMRFPPLTFVDRARCDILIGFVVQPKPSASLLTLYGSISSHCTSACEPQWSLVSV